MLLLLFLCITSFVLTRYDVGAKDGTRRGLDFLIAPVRFPWLMLIHIDTAENTLQVSQLFWVGKSGKI